MAPRAPYGSLLKPDKPQKPRKVGFTLGRNPRVKDDGHLECLRQLPCLTCGQDPAGEAAHIRYTTLDRPNPGLAQKPNDTEAVPLCRPCHTEQHSKNEQTFWQSHEIDPLRVAAELAKHSPATEQMRAVVFAVRAIANLGRTP